MNVEEIRKKLSTAVYLERESFFQQKVMDSLNNESSKLGFKNKFDKPEKNSYDGTAFKMEDIIFPMLSGLILGMIIGLPLGFGFMGALILGFCFGIFFTWKTYSNCSKSYQKKLDEYYDKVKKDLDRVELENKKKEYYAIENNIFANTHDETLKNLKNLYSSDWLYPKYQNLVAVTSILEYIESGRCDSLTGPNGAYNIFENELKMNTIINKLDRIIENLSAIKENQFILYQEMNYANQKMDAMFSNIENEFQRIASNIDSHTSALNYNSEAQIYASKEIQKELEYMNKMNYRAGNYD